MAKLRILVAIVCLCAGTAAPVRANVVTDWNEITVLYTFLGDATAVPAIPAGRPGPHGLLDAALVHLAMHDAVQAIEGRYRPYHYSDSTKWGIGLPAAAAAAAAHRVLVLLYPTQQASLDARYANYLVVNGLAGNAGLAVGEAAGAELFNAHYRPIIPLPNFLGVSEPGQWRSGAPMQLLYLAVSRPFTLNRVDQFRPPPPPPLGSMQYTREYDEVKARGQNSAHPNAETSLAQFWSGNFMVQFNVLLRQLASTQALDVGESARYFALSNVAMSDTAMAVWDSKYFYNFWRPDMAIRNADTDGNPRTEAHTTWTPLFANPVYPDYVSGANGLSGSFTSMATLFFGTDQKAFSMRSVPLQPANPERFYTSFSQLADEIVEARILLGIHFRSADEEARRLGNRVAHWVFQKFLAPIPGTH